jgi:hypothetical protein
MKPHRAKTTAISLCVIAPSTFLDPVIVTLIRGILIKLARERPFGGQCRVVQLCSRQNYHSSLPCKLKVCCRVSNEYLADEGAEPVENLHAITTSRVHVAIRVNMDSIRDTWTDISEYLAVIETAVFLDIEAVTSKFQCQHHNKLDWRGTNVHGGGVVENDSIKGLGHSCIGDISVSSVRGEDYA